jgi:hypothetical protein
MNKLMVTFVGGVLAALVGVLIVANMFPVAAQERLEQWQIGRVLRTAVGVIDTGAVCIYVSEITTAQGRGVAPGGIFVVPKTQLPNGKGCQ